MRRLLTFARPEVARTETVELDRLISETESLTRSDLTPQIRLVLRKGPEGADVTGSWTSLQQVLMNLMVNARDAMPDGGTLTVARRLVTGAGTVGPPNWPAGVTT